MIKARSVLSCVFLFVLVFAAVGCGGNGDSPKDTVQSFYDALVKGDYKAAHALLSKGDQAFLTLDLFEMSMEEEGDLEDPDFKVLNEKIDGDKATVEVESSDGKETVHLVKEDGKWKISFLGGFEDMMMELDEMDFDMDFDMDDLDFDMDDLDFDWDDLDINGG